MAGPVLESKLHVPRRRRDLVARPRLDERLSRGAGGALTLVSAPAGFGKTTLLTEWLARRPADGPAAGWLSLDVRDNDPSLFWTYVVAALGRALERVAGSAALSPPQPSELPVEAVVATLLNELALIPDDVVLVLDDFHVIETPVVHESLAFVLKHLPPQIHLVISTRADPALRLAGLRGRGELVEIRAADLRFTRDECQAYLAGAMGLDLTAGQTAMLEDRTEGWIVALQLAALSMQRREDIGAFIDGFAGDDRYIVDYLAEEVLQRQPEQVRSFLLQTSILSRLTAGLCDAVTGQGGGRATLEALDRANLFLVPLDDRRRWYRYHHLFADVLRARLLDEQPDRPSELHARASVWYEAHGEPSDAIAHALAAGDFERAADLVEQTIPALRRNRQDATLRTWLGALPPELVRARPLLSIGLVGVLMAEGELDRVEGPLRDAERWLAATADGEERALVEADEEYRRLPGAVEMYRAAQAHALGDGPGTVTHARRAIDLSTDDDHLNRAAAAGFLGLASWAAGDLEAAEDAYTACSAGLRRAGHDADVLGAAVALADLRIAQGRLGAALRTYEHALEAVPETGMPVLRGAADMHVGMSEVHRERNELDAARQHLLRADELGEPGGLHQHRYRRPLAMALLLQTEGDLHGALDLLAEAQRLHDGSDFLPDVRPIPAVRARIHIASGDLGAALGWARERKLSVDDDVCYLREFEHLTLCRVLLARYPEEQAQGSDLDAARLLDRLLPEAEDAGRTGSVIEVLVLRALAHAAGGDRAGALSALERAVTLAEPEGYVRTFVDVHPPLAALLAALAKQGAAQHHVRRLQAAAVRERGGQRAQVLVEPLSERELEVLRLLGSDLDGPQIARELVVSLNTVRTHTKHIYAKLGVSSRRAAVRQGNELGLL